MEESTQQTEATGSSTISSDQQSASTLSAVLSSTPISSAPSSVDLFIDALPSLLTRQEIEAYYKLTPLGLFLVESELEHIVDLYKAWFEKSGLGLSQRSVEKAKRRLFEREQPEPYYIFEGKKPIPGYLITLRSKPKSSTLLQYRDKPLSALTQLHLRDPILYNTPGLISELDRDGLKMKVTLKGLAIYLDPNTPTVFYQIAKRSRALKKRFPNCADSVRSALPALVQLLQLSHPISRKRFHLLPTKARKGDEFLVCRAGPLMFMLNRTDHLSDLSELHASGLWDFLVQELNLTSELDGLRGIKSIRIKRTASQSKITNRSKIVAELLTPTRSYLLPRAALINFISLIPDLQPTPKVAQKPSTLRDILVLLGDLFTKASKAQSERVAKRELRSVDNLQFVISSDLTIEAIRLKR
jgi:hypothetical protein